MAAQEPAIAIEANRVSKVFGSGQNEVRALDDVSVKIRQNEFFTLLGPSGCGKTTLLRMVAGFEAPTAGTILLDGEDITATPPNHRPINTVFQSYALFPHLTVAQNVAFGLEMLGKPRKEISDTVARMLAMVRMEQLANRTTAQISGGQQQRVALARALAPRPKVLLLDEPLSALDLKLRKEMQIELKRLQTETGITFIFVTHDQEEALTMSDRIAVMSAGRILQIGSPEDIYNRPSGRFVASFIGESNFFEGTVQGVKGDTAEIRMPSGHVIKARLGKGKPEGSVTFAVRPEHIRLEQFGIEGTIPAKVTRTVYFGTDTHCHLELDGGERLVARLQNTVGGNAAYDTGMRAGVRFDDGAAQVLID
ncbi:MAG: ABC transporter ATP-binding protein [Tepidamorphaceae bacterium]|nr:ABC transporter ATP-binding protein [Rhodobiaceae bacterium]MCC0047950.1 ABC transporter ATP-binding protein [Rhodobiaceae bacterium]